MKKLFLLPLIIFGLTANATDRYISTSGNDGNSGASSSPWRTLAYAASHSSSGDLIHVAAGTYVESSRVDLPEGVSITGAGGSTTIIQSTYSIAASGQSQDDAIILLNSSSVSGTGQTISYLTFDGRNLASTRAICINQRSNVIISNCTIQNFLLSAITINHGGGSFTSGMEIHDCSINNCATDDPSVDTHSNSGSITLFGINGMLIYNNSFTQTARATGQNGDIIRGIDSYFYGLKGLKIYNNTFTKNNSEGTQWNFTIELWHLSDECEVYNNVFNGTGGMDFCGIQKGNGSYGLSVHDNTVTASANFAQPSGGPSEQGINFENANAGSLNNTGVQQYIYVYNNYFKYIPNPIRFDFTISDSDTKGLMDHIYVYDNVFDQFGYTNNVGVSMGIYMNDHAQSPITYDNIHIYNNTFVGNSYSQQGVKWNCYGTAHTNFSIDNNIFSGLRSNPISFSAVSGSPSVTIISVQNNDYYNNSTNTPSYSGVTMNSKSEQNSITTNPLFISSTNYQLQPSSPCINAGINVGLPFSGSAPDIGRYEYASSGPLANAGPDQIITLPTNIDTLKGSGTVANGTITSYQWTKISGPSSGTITNSSSATTSVTGLVQGVYQFQLLVTDNNGATGIDVVQITVNAAATTKPLANAGLDQTIILPINNISLSGSGTDSGGTITNFFWTKISGPSFGSITNASSATTTVTGLVQGVYQFELKVTDNNGAVGRDTMQVTVNAAVIINIPPVANAGLDQTITLPASTVTLSGSGSDVNGTVTGYLWTKISGPSTFNIVNAASPVTDVSGLVQGVYKFELKVTDNNGAVGRDTMQVTVNAAVIVNIPPVANAGLDQTITLPASTVTLTGIGSDANGTVTGYLWTKISGPSTFNIVNAASPVTDVSGLVQGVYKFELKVTDNNGAVGRDTMQVTVNAAVIVNIPPVANAGLDQTITLPASTVTLTGIGSDANGTVTGYLWTKISGPSAFNIVNAASPVTDVSGLVQGIYMFELKVTDNNGAVGRDTMQVTVNAAVIVNIPPVANAGPDQTITLPASTVTLTGSGSDANGTVTGYLWTKISGPSTFNIVNAVSSVTDVSGLVQGIYQFELKVTDNNGAVGRDTMQVTVNAAPKTNKGPIAKAGPHKTLTLPSNITTLTGSATSTNGSISSYSWTKISGPSAGTITTANSPVTSVTGLVQGVYQFELKVVDSIGASGRDTTQVTVNTASVANIAPVANAGLDQTITLPTSSTSLSGTGTDPDGTITGYSWKQISGPSFGSLVSPNDSVTFLNNLVGGTYKFELSVTDNLGAIGRDTVYVVVAVPRLNLDVQSNNISIYPNPVMDITTLEINTTKANQQLLVVISNMQGSIVYKSELASGQTNIKDKLNISNLSKGTYAVTVYFSKWEKQTIKVLKL